MVPALIALIATVIVTATLMLIATTTTTNAITILDIALAITND